MIIVQSGSLEPCKAFFVQKWKENEFGLQCKRSSTQLYNLSQSTELKPNKNYLIMTEFNQTSSVYTPNEL